MSRNAFPRLEAEYNEREERLDEARASRLRHEEEMRGPKIGIVEAVKQAVAHNTDHWTLYLRKVEVKPGRFGGQRSILSFDMQYALDERHTHDSVDAAHMRLCLDANDTIRNLYLRGDV